MSRGELWREILNAPGLLVGTAANLLIIGLNICFYLEASRLPPGTGVRPMGLTFIFGLVVFGALIIGLPLSIAGRIANGKAGNRTGMRLGSIGILLNVIPLPLSMILLQVAGWLAGVWFEP
jgi:uncharacterized BrkB/YihY/UPF0761 family membrane protein